MGWRMGLGVLLAAASLLVARPPTVRADAALVQAAPAGGAVLATAPARIDLVFAGDLDAERSRLRVYDAADGRADRDDLQVEGKRMTIGVRDLPPGAYRVRWVAAGDGPGEARGGYTFQIGAPRVVGPRLGVSPDRGDAGQMMTIGGDGFGPNALVLVAIGDEQRSLGAVRVDGQGRFALQTLVPEYLPHGRQVVQALDLDGRMATAPLHVQRGGWPPLGATLSAEAHHAGELEVAIQLVNRSGWHLRQVEVRATIPPGTRVLREGLEGPDGVEWTIEGNEVVWRGARA